jgi:hypothetical protein
MLAELAFKPDARSGQGHHRFWLTIQTNQAKS